MTPTEVSNYLGVPLATVYGWRYRGTGPPGIRVGRHLRFRSSDVERWLDARGSECPTARTD
jgi:excisionase family DNA binding protein